MKCHCGRECPGSRSYSVLILMFLAILFLVGIIAGQLFLRRLAPDISFQLENYLKDYVGLRRSRQIAPRTFWAAVLLYFRYPLLAFLCAFSSFGIMLIPLVTTTYGFFLSFSAGCFTSVLGADGVILAASIFGMRCAFSLPCYLLIAEFSWIRSRELFHLTVDRNHHSSLLIYDRSYWICCGVCVVILFVGVLAELLLEPWLIQSTWHYLA